MLVECRTCGAEIDAPINADLGAAQCGVCRQDGVDSEREQRLSTLSARVVEAAVEEYWIHRDAAREHVTKGRQYCQCGICAAVDALIAERQR